MLMQLRMLKLSVEKGRQVIKQPSFAQVAILQSIAERVGYVLYRALVYNVLSVAVHARSSEGVVVWCTY